jgi:hypothetical protein
MQVGDGHVDADTVPPAVRCLPSVAAGDRPPRGYLPRSRVRPCLRGRGAGTVDIWFKELDAPHAATTRISFTSALISIASLSMIPVPSTRG